jgi:hypothetical protein
MDSAAAAGLVVSAASVRKSVAVNPRRSDLMDAAPVTRDGDTAA